MSSLEPSGEVVVVSSDKLLGNLSMLQGQLRNLTTTVQAQKATEITHQWFVEYGIKNEWGIPNVDTVATLLRQKLWRGIPINASATRFDIGSAMINLAKNRDMSKVLQVANAILWRAKMTGMGMAKHPTWVGESALVLSLLDEKTADLPPLSILCESKLPLVTNVFSGVVRRPVGLDLGKTKEVKSDEGSSAIQDFLLYSTDPSRIDSKLQSQITR